MVAVLLGLPTLTSATTALDGSRGSDPSLCSDAHMLLNLWHYAQSLHMTCKHNMNCFCLNMEHVTHLHVILVQESG